MVKIGRKMVNVVIECPPTSLITSISSQHLIAAQSYNQTTAVLHEKALRTEFVCRNVKFTTFNHQNYI